MLSVNKITDTRPPMRTWTCRHKSLLASEFNPRRTVHHRLTLSMTAAWNFEISREMSALYRSMAPSFSFDWQTLSTSRGRAFELCSSSNELLYSENSVIGSAYPTDSLIEVTTMSSSVSGIWPNLRRRWRANSRPASDCCPFDSHIFADE